MEFFGHGHAQQVKGLYASFWFLVYEIYTETLVVSSNLADLKNIVLLFKLCQCINAMWARMPEGAGKKKVSAESPHQEEVGVVAGNSGDQGSGPLLNRKLTYKHKLKPVNVKLHNVLNLLRT